MEINGLTSNTAATAYTNANTVAETAAAPAANETASEKKETNEAAVYEPSTAETAKKSQTYKPDVNRVRELMAENERQVDSFRRMIETLLNKQAQKSNTAFPWQQNQEKQAQGTGEQMIEIDPETRAAAQKEIEEGGYFSVEKTAGRILDFAVALSGGDPSKIETLKDGFVKGFEAATKAWGSKLPEISQKTYEAVLNGFDEWEKAGSSDAITLLNNNNSK